MGKDPAFLFYSDHFMIGTQFFTDEQTGKYIRLLCAQHQHGHLTEQQFSIICKTHDEHILSKFVKDDNGLLYNQRLQIEIDKRKNYSDSRRNNRLSEGKQKPPKKKPVISSSYDIHMVNVNEDVNVNAKWILLIQEWLDYKKDKRQNYKTQQSLQKFAERLYQYANKDLYFGKLIIDKSIANNYDGIFELKPGQMVKSNLPVDDKLKKSSKSAYGDLTDEEMAERDRRREMEGSGK